jgi:glycosyltransferase involved in cell wall biosynthesis
MRSSTGSIAMCIEQTLGHRTHGRNLEIEVHRSGANARLLSIAMPDSRVRLPWALTGSRIASDLVRSLPERPRVTFFHTQTIGLFAGHASRGNPYVVSVDATPVQVDSLGRWYDHRRSAAPLEYAKHRWYRRMFGGAEAMVAWSNWAKRSLVDDYGVAESRVTVIHPGAPDALFDIPRVARQDGPMRVLFVGGDYLRKGGDTLAEAARRVAEHCHVTFMTEADVAAPPNGRILRGIRPGMPEFTQAFMDADIFCLPTRGDCTPVAIGEAMAAGLPVITTNVGSNSETVPEGAGLLVGPDDPADLANALRELASDGERRTTMGRRAREHARDRLSSSRNAALIVDMLTKLAR